MNVSSTHIINKISLFTIHLKEITLGTYPPSLMMKIKKKLLMILLKPDQLEHTFDLDDDHNEKSKTNGDRIL